MAKKHIKNKATFREVVRSIAKIIEDYHHVTRVQIPKAKGLRSKDGKLGPRGSRGAQYQMLAEIYDVLRGYPDLEKSPDKDSSRAVAMGSDTISQLMSAAFKKFYEEGSRSKRQRLRVWSDVMKWLWVHDVDPEHGVLSILNDGGIDMVSVRWTLGYAS